MTVVSRSHPSYVDSSEAYHCTLQARLKICEDDVHIWSVYIPEHHHHLNYLQEQLTAEETERANRFHFEKDQNQFIVGRGLLRIILSRYIQSNPKQISFHYNSFGKPSLNSNAYDNGILFNLSHSGNQILYAISRNREVGVDIEKIRPMKDAGQIVDRYFSEKEKKAFHNLPNIAKDEAFFRIWTQKEAVVKALGLGLSHSFDCFNVSVSACESEKLVQSNNNKNNAHNSDKLWYVRSIPSPEGYVGAVAVEGNSARCIFKQIEFRSGFKIPSQV